SADHEDVGVDVSGDEVRRDALIRTVDAERAVGELVLSAGAVGPGVNVAQVGVDRVVRDASVQAQRRVDVVGSVATDGPGVAQVRVRVGDQAGQGRRSEVLLDFTTNGEGVGVADVRNDHEAAGAQVSAEG